MHSIIVSGFWSDTDFEAYEGQELANARIVFLWCATGPSTNKAGIFPISRDFTHHTGLAMTWLHKITAEMGRSFRMEGRHGLLRNYVRYQFGTGPRLASNRNMCKAIISDLRNSVGPLAVDVLLTYPELQPYLSPSEALAKGLPSPSEALAGANGNFTQSGTHSVQQNQGSARIIVPRGTTHDGSPTQGLSKPPEDQYKDQDQDQGIVKGSEVLIPSLEEVTAHGDRLGIPPEVCAAFFNYHEARGWMSGATRLRKPLALLQSFAAQHRIIKKGGRPERAAGGGTADDLRAQLQGTNDPQARENLREQIRQLEARRP